MSPVSSLHPVRGTPAEILGLLRAWNAEESEPPPLVVATSGSTGEPKRVLLSRAAMRASAEATAGRLGGPGQWLLNLPATHVAGLQLLFRSVLAGTEPVLADGSLADASAGMAGGRRYVSLVPTQLRRMLADPEDTAALRGFTTVLVGGAAVPAELRADAVRAGITVVATYGMSETCGGCVYDGQPLDGVAVGLVGAEGRVRLGGPVLFDGYEDEPALTAETLGDGWFLTQDLGRIDPDGRLEILGRVDDVVLSGGVNVPGPAVAARLRAHPRVSAAEVLGRDDAEWGQRVVAYVVGQLTLEEARDWVADVHPRAWAPRQLVRLEEMPLLGNGKLDRRRLEQLAR